ncbi:MAG: UDP-N-acetylmuramate dehydrogenase [Cyanobacteria bacterium J06641_5]
MVLASTPTKPMELDGLVQPDVELAEFTSFRVGGPAQWYAAPRSRADLDRVLAWGRERELPLVALGAGSNLLVGDRGVPGLVIATRHLRGVSFDDANGRLTAAAGAPIATVGWKAAKRGWRGLEWSVGVPGLVGGSVVMNAGAHRACLADSLVSVQVLDTVTGEVATVSNSELAFAYRTSNLQGRRDRIVLEATFALQPGATRELVMAESRHNLNYRKTTQPYHLPSCGSVFRNPDSHAAGWLIEQTGLKGYRVGGAQVAERHANFILNCGDAKASDISELINCVRDRVEDRWSIRLQPEVKLLGEF